MSIERERVIVGMDVLDRDSDRLGSVKAVHDDHFVLDRRLRRDLRVPFTAVRELSGRVIVLAHASGELDRLGWDSTALLPEAGEAAGEGEPASIVTGSGDPAERGTWSAAADNYDLDPTETLTGGTTRDGVVSRPDRSDTELADST